MADYRTRREKLEAMANQTDSPHEAAVAREKLQKMGADTKPPPNKKTAPPRGSTSYEYMNVDDLLRRYRDLRQARYGFNGQYYGAFYQQPADMLQYMFMGGPWHGETRTVRKTDQTVNAPVYERTGGGAEPLGVNMRSGTYLKRVTADGKEFFEWAG